MASTVQVKSEPDDIIQRILSLCRETEEMLMKKQDFLEKKIEIELDVARKNAKTNKRAAIQVTFLRILSLRQSITFLL